MSTGEPLFQLLYLSRLAPSCDFAVVKDIVAVARHHNPPAGISGSLLFDGERFCQLLEGAEATVRALMDRIERDTRHTDLLVLSAALTERGRLLPHWRSGYCDVHQLEGFDGADGLRGQRALDTFMSVLHGADVE